MSEDIEIDTIDAGHIGNLELKELRVDIIETGHIPLAIWNGKRGAESKQGVKHLYSDKYRERWPQDQFPEKYEEDIPVD